MKKKDHKNELQVHKGDVELAHEGPVYTPDTDILERDNDIIVKTDMPGVDLKNVDVTLEDDVLTITGHQCKCAMEDYHLIHRGYETGIYRRAFNVLADIDHDKINAKMDHGVLTITLPKAEKAKPKKITVELG